MQLLFQAIHCLQAEETFHGNCDKELKSCISNTYRSDFKRNVEKKILASFFISKQPLILLPSLGFLAIESFCWSQHPKTLKKQGCLGIIGCHQMWHKDWDIDLVAAASVHLHKPDMVILGGNPVRVFWKYLNSTDISNYVFCTIVISTYVRKLHSSKKSAAGVSEVVDNQNVVLH